MLLNIYNQSGEIEKNDFPLKKENKKRINNLIFKIIEPKNSQIVYYKKFQYTKKIPNNKTNWYESALITTIVGGLAYLFYFGTN